MKGKLMLFQGMLCILSVFICQCLDVTGDEFVGENEERSPRPQYETTFVRYFGEENKSFRAFSMEVDRAGGYVLAGDSLSCAGGCDMNLVVVKATEEGDSLWSFEFGERTTDERARSVIQTGDGGYAVVGTKNTRHETDDRILLVRFNSEGELLWSREYSPASRTFGEVVLPTVDGGLVIGGRGEDGDSQIGFLLRLDSKGDELWYQEYVHGVMDLKVRVDGGFVGCGGSTIFTLDDTGQQETIRQFPSNVLYGLDTTADGGVVASGYSFENGSYDPPGLILKTDAEIELQWRHVLRRGMTPSVSETSDGGFVAAGDFEYTIWDRSDVILYRFDSTGREMWVKRYEDISGTMAWSCFQTADNGFVLAGWAHVNSEGAMLLMKTDRFGDVSETTGSTE